MAVRYVQRQLNEAGRPEEISKTQEVEPLPPVSFQVGEYLYSVQREILVKFCLTHSRTKLYLKPDGGRKFRSKRKVHSFIIAIKRLRNKEEMKDNSVMPSNNSGPSDKKDLLGSKTPGEDLNKKDPLWIRIRELRPRRTGCSFSVGDPRKLINASHSAVLLSDQYQNSRSKDLPQ